MSNAIAIMWKCSECSLEYEDEENAESCCEALEENAVEDPLLDSEDQSVSEEDENSEEVE